MAEVDEVGRGCWAGPVVAGAVVLLRGLSIDTLCDVHDSTQMTELQREKMNLVIQNVAVTFGIGEASSEDIDAKGILNATKLAMQRAISALKLTPDYYLIDAVRLAGALCKAIIHGDALVLSIAAVSVIAKCYRDHLMREISAVYTGYGFERNAGYGVPQHIQALNELGITPIHRKSFRPISTLATVA